MTERITTEMMDNTTLYNIDNDLNQLDTAQEDLSTGYDINSPSDDPVGAAETLTLQSEVSAYSSYTDSIDQGTSIVETESSSLQTIQSVLQRAQELTVEAATGTMSSTDLGDTAQEILQDIAEIKQTANTQYDGSYIFSGSDVDTEPYDDSATADDPAGEDTYNGNTDTVSVAIGPSTQLPVNANLYSVLGNGVTTGDAASSYGGGAVNADGSGGLLATLRTIYNDMTGTNGGTQSDLGNQLTNLDTNQTALEAVQADVGATQDRLQMAASRITTLSETDTTELGNVYDTDMPSETVTYSTEQATYEAALQSTSDIIQTSLLNYLSS